MELDLLHSSSLSILELSLEEEIALTASISKLQTEVFDKQKVYFWGKVNGVYKDYYLVFTVENTSSSKIPVKQFYYSINCVNYKELPDAPVMTSEVDESDRSHTFTPLTGDPFHTIQTPKGEMEEAVRLSQMVQRICQETSAMPEKLATYRYVGTKDESNQCNLSWKDCGELSNWVHFREFKNEAAHLCRNSKSELPFDQLDKDLPYNCWSIRTSYDETCVVVASLMYPGYKAYCIPSFNQYGEVYFGYGNCSNDLAFLLW